MADIKRFAGADWLVENLTHRGAEPPSALGRDVADVLGIAFCGIYHIASSQLFHNRTHWGAERYIEIVLTHTLSTYDFDELGDLVMGCLQRRIRMEISAAAPRYLRLTFMRDTPSRHPEPSAYIADLIARTTPEEVPHAH